MGITTTNLGQHQGKRVDQFTLTSATGAVVDIIGYGVAVRDWQVPLAGGMRSVVLGFESFEPYPEHSPHFGSLAGRVANRIAGSQFVLDGKTYRLAPNWENLHLHGGLEGLGRQVWDGEIDSAGTGVRFTHVSPDGAMGYPGEVKFTAHYRLEGNRLHLELSAMPDRPTPISLVQHQYFNLGTGPDVLDHEVTIKASAYTPLDQQLVPTGAILPVDGTQYDLRTPRALRDDTGAPVDYDINLVLETGRPFEVPAATVIGPDRALKLELFTDRPGIQFYNGVWTDVAVPGLGGRRYGKHSGLCLEDQALPDALHHGHFPSIIHTPDRPYHHRSSIEIAPLED